MNKHLRARKFLDYAIPEPNSGCWLWTGHLGSDGYPRLFWDRHHQRGNRISYEMHKGPIPAGLFVCHKCDTPSCVNPDHLFLGTSEDNFADMRRKKRNPRGTASGSAKLTDQQVLEIRLDNRTVTEISADYAVTAVLIGKIKRREIWQHLAGDIVQARKWKLTSDQVAIIRSASGRYADIGATFGVTGTMVGYIKRGHSWK